MYVKNTELFQMTKGLIGVSSDPIKKTYPACISRSRETILHLSVVRPSLDD